jgi:lipoprotein-anchoring transpeptidase ErfK/SrfK
MPYGLAGPSDWALKLCEENPDRYDCSKLKIPKKRKIKYLTWNQAATCLTGSHTNAKILIAINRRNTLIWHNHIIATPKNRNETYMDHSPFRKVVDIKERNYIVVDLNKLAWAAYDNGNLINWGPANGGSKRCKETGLLKCKTHTGVYFVLRLDKVGKRSDLYPVDCKDKKKCGHEMPYFMPFHPDGSGVHGDRWLVGRNASHGCVRLIKEDAKWINKKFAYVGMPIIIMDY